MTTALTPSQGTAIDVTALTGPERTVALYASDMPNRRRNHGPQELRAWIAQGVERLGVDTVRQWARFYAGHRVLESARVMTAPVQARHEQRFPRANRLVWASQMSANLLWRFPPTAEAAARDAIEVDGGCPCQGTGEITLWGPGISMMCPVHSRAQIAAFRRGYRAGA
ncbi:hypothetical protein ACFW5V_20760 [Streptomyces sp. NPDC058762]|uniref:hypothetical protein n=1 Tax=Streptomyces sp. NPDC058762 TaxID=3346629 RepID=UPI0036764473